MALIDIPHVVDAYPDPKWIIHPDGSIEQRVIVITDLEMNVLHPKYGKEAADKLLAALSEHSRNPHRVGKLVLKTRR
ncbi:MAG: hypothetical protein ACREHF_08140 [Rhizomicrobium sp.]